MASYAYHIASVTGWAYREIMEDLPFTAGLQIIDADLYAKGIERVHTRGIQSAVFDSVAMMDKAIAKLQKR